MVSCLTLIPATPPGPAGIALSLSLQGFDEGNLLELLGELALYVCDSTSFTTFATAGLKLVSDECIL